MVDLAVRTENLGDSDQGFIVKPSDITEVGCTLNLALFTPVDGVIPAGTPLAKVTASGLYGPYDDGGTGGLEVFAGRLFDTIPTRGKTTGNVGASRIVVGAVYAAKCPDSPNAAAVTAMKSDHPTIAHV